MNKLFSAQLRPTNVCQLDCLGCWYYGQNVVGKPIEWKKKVLPLEKCEELFKDLSEIGFRDLVVAGGGDPLAHPQIYDILKSASSKFSVRLLTNLLLCNDPEALLRTGIKEMIVNTSAATEETFAKFHPNQRGKLIKGVSPFKRLLDLIVYLKPQIQLKLNFVIGKVNIEETFLFLELVHRLGVEASFKNLRDSQWGLSDEERVVLAEKLPQLKSSAERLGIQTNLDSFHPWEGQPPIHTVSCYAGYYTTVIEADGSVCVCCLPGADRMPISNIYHSRFKEIWTSPEYDRVRNKFLAKQFEPFCKECIYFKRNQEFEKQFNPIKRVESSLS